jgi:hypothetical protein
MVRMDDPSRGSVMPAYDAFISYSHAKDKSIASALQSVVQKLGKPWYQRRALRVFRDDTSLSATPGLWPTIERALGQSRYFVLLASPEAAASKLRILNFGGGPVDTRGAAGRLILNVFAAFAQFELEIMKERQREGIADAKAAGRYKGRKPTARAKAADAVKLFQEGKRVSQVAQQLGIGRASVYRALEEAGLHS